MKTVDENILLGELFNLAPEAFNAMDISELSFSIRVKNRLYWHGINTVGELLRVDSAFLINLKGFGRNCLDQVYELLGNLSSGNVATIIDQEEVISSTINIAKKHREQIFSGDFSFIELGNYSSDEKAFLKEYEGAYDILGKELIFDCVENKEKILPIIRAFNQYCGQVEKYKELKKIAENIPVQRRENCCKYYIRTYTFDENLRKQLTAYYQTENSPLISVIETVNFEDDSAVEIITKFLKWCSYDISEQISEMFEKLYANERQKNIIEGRAKGQTLNEIGEHLNITRERVRQIEMKAKRLFVWWQSRLKILAKIYSDMNGQSIITQEDIADVSGNNAVALIYLLRISESSYYTYDAQLDAFVFGDTDISSRIQLFVDSLPDVIKKSELQDILDSAEEQDGLSRSYVEKAILEAYKTKGDVLHRSRLTLAKIYEAVLKTHYPNGLHVYDDQEIAELRKTIIAEYGDLGLPETNRAIAARISNIGVLSGRGRYIAKRKQWISKTLENQLVKYIDESESPIILIGSIFYEFENELTKEGIDNRYFLQGVLREIVGDRYFFRRDYISRDSNFTSIYSSIISFIKASRYPVKKEEIQAKFQGITDIVITMATGDSDILNYFGEYLHAGRLVISENEKEHLFNQLSNLLSNGEAHHIKDLYDTLLEENTGAFSRNAVNSSFRAYSVLEYLFRDQFQFLRPYVAVCGVEISRAAERLHDMIYDEDTYLISDISEFAKENHLQIQSLIEYINSLNDKYLLRDTNTIVSISSLGISEQIIKNVECVIVANIDGTMPIRNLTCIGQFPLIKGNWSEWLIYSCLLKWSTKLDVALSSSQLRQSIPLVSLKGEMDLSNFKDMPVAPIKIKIDDMNEIDELLSEIITEDMLEDI